MCCIVLYVDGLAEDTGQQEYFDAYVCFAESDAAFVDVMRLLWCGCYGVVGCWGVVVVMWLLWYGWLLWGGCCCVVAMVMVL